MQGKYLYGAAAIVMAILTLWSVIDVLFLRQAPIAELWTELTIFAILFLPIIPIAFWLYFRNRLGGNSQKSRRNETESQKGR